MRGGGLFSRAVKWVVAPTCVAALSAAAYSIRPIYYDEPLGAVQAERGDLLPNEQIQRSHPNQTFVKTGLYSPRTDQESALMKAARGATIHSVVALGRLFMEVLNDTKVAGDVRYYEQFMELVHLGEKRGRGMITVSNHTSVFDDPVLQASITKFVHPDKMRWGICKESICFTNPTVSAFIGGGKVLPVKVGAGLEQVAFKGFARRLADGEWIHIYPEAACIQTGSLGKHQLIGARDEKRIQEIGRLKWGVGKLAGRIAFGEGQLPPIIIPYYHVGMHRIKPQKNLPTDNGLADPWYIIGRTGKKVRIYFGPPIYIDDLIHDYEMTIGQKRRLAVVNRENDEFLDWEGSTKEELHLYSKITKRIEEALLRLEEEAKQDSSKQD